MTPGPVAESALTALTAATSGSLAGAAAAAVAAAGLGVIAHGTMAPGSRIFGPVISRAPEPVRPAVALTFDDGPWPGSTDRILEVLEREGVRASFFVIGRYAAEQPGLLRRIHDAGHLIGNHTFDHSRVGMFRGPTYWLEQIRRTADTIAGLTGERSRWFRPPMGFKSPIVMRAARTLNHGVVTWSRRAYDGVPTDAAAIIRNLRRARPGEILLLHDGRDPASRRSLGPTAGAISQVIADLRGAQLAMVRLDELLRLGPGHSSSQAGAVRRA